MRAKWQNRRQRGCTDSLAFKTHDEKTAMCTAVFSGIPGAHWKRREFTRPGHRVAQSIQHSKAAPIRSPSVQRQGWSTLTAYTSAWSPSARPSPCACAFLPFETASCASTPPLRRRPASPTRESPNCFRHERTSSSSSFLC